MFEAKSNFSGIQRLTIDKLNNDGCINLLETFLIQLSEDYRCILREFIHNQSDRKLRTTFKKARKFILSDYFALLTGLDGSEILGTLDGNYRSTLEVLNV